MSRALHNAYYFIFTGQGYDTPWIFGINEITGGANRSESL